jgi:hypothetical protein
VGRTASALAPLLAVLVLALTVFYWTSADFGIRVEYEGVDVGYIADEGTYMAAADLARERVHSENGEFTINVPVKGADCKQILSLCGTKSGRDMDKIKELGLTLEEPEVISVPGIKELPITLECRVVYKQDQDLSFLDEDKRLRYYAPGTANDGDYHTAYYGEVLAAYIIEE